MVVTKERVEPLKISGKESSDENTLRQRGCQMLMPRIGKLLGRQRNGKFQRRLAAFDSEARELAEMTSQAARKGPS